VSPSINFNCYGTGCRV